MRFCIHWAVLTLPWFFFLNCLHCRIDSRLRTLDARLKRKIRMKTQLLECLYLTISSGPYIYTGWPKKNATTLIRNFNDWFFLLYWIEYSFPSIWHQVQPVWIRRFDSRAIFMRQSHFQNVLLPPPPPPPPPPPQAGLKQREFFIWRRPLWLYQWDSATKLRNEFLGFIHIVFLFKVRAKIMFYFCQHSWFNGTPSDEKFPLLQACLRGEK